jgi:hypothetical protein
VTNPSPTNRWLAFAEIFVIFALFALQGSWPVPDVNEAHYLGKAAHYWNPDWIRGDFFLDSADSHKVYYFSFGWVTLWLSMPAAAWTGRIIAWLLMAWSWRRLSTALLPRPGWSILSAALFIMLNERLQMAGEWFIGGIEAKDFAYVFMLLGLEALVRDRWNRAWLLFGASAGFHALVGGWAVAAAGVAWIFLGKKTSPLPLAGTTEWSGPGVRAEGAGRPPLLSMLPSLCGGFLLSLPGLIPALALNRNIDAEIIRQANVIYVFERLRHHLDIFQFKMEFLYRFAAMTFCYLVLCRLINKLAGKAPPEEQTADDATSDGFRRMRILQCFVAGSLSIALIGILIDMTSFYDRTFAAGLLRFYWFRLADIIVPLGSAFVVCYWTLQRLRVKYLEGMLWLILATGLVCIHFGGYIPQRIHPGPARGDLNMTTASLVTRIDQPSPSKADRLENVAAWRDVCQWIRENTPTDARFFTPRLSQTFKWYARRAEVATWKDVPQDAAALVAWWNRIQDVFATGSEQPEFRWRENVTDLEPKQLDALAEKYQAEYIVAPPGNPPPGWKVIYENKGYSKKNKGYAVYRRERGQSP